MVFDAAYMLNNHPVFLEDVKANVLHDLTKGDMTFMYDTLFHNRFVLHIGGSGDLNTSNVDQAKNNQVWVYDGILHVQLEEQANALVFDAQGRKVWSTKHEGGFRRYDLPNMASGVYTVTLETSREIRRKKFVLTR